METPIFKRVSKGDLKGWMRGEILDHLPPTFFDDPVSSIQKMGGKVIKESKWRWAAIFSLSDGRRIFIKRDWTKDWVEHLKYLFFPTKGQKEFFIASQLEKRDVNLPKPLGWMKRVRRGLVRESYFLSEAIGAGVSFIEEVAKSKESLSIIELAKTVKKFQDARIISPRSSRRKLSMGWGFLVPDRFTSRQNGKTSLLEQEVMEFSPPFPFFKIDVGRRRTTPIPESIF